MSEGTIDGLWTAEFASSAGLFGGGVVIFRDGKLSGGDGTYFYLGSYRIDGEAFHATLKVSPYIDGAESVFKTKGQDLTLDLAGSLISSRQAIAQGHPLEVPNLKFGVKLTKRS